MITRKVTLKKLAEWIPILQDVGCVSKHPEDDRAAYDKWKYCAERNKIRFAQILNNAQKKLEEFAENTRADIDPKALDELAIAEKAIVDENCDKTHGGSPVMNEAGNPTFSKVGEKKVQKLFDDLHAEMADVVAAEKAAQERIDEYCKEHMDSEVEVLIFARAHDTVPLNIDAAYKEAAGFMIKDAPADDEIED